MARYIFPFAVALASACAVGLMLSSSAQATENPIEGGPGGGPFTVTCNGGFMIGFEGRTGAYIDQFRIVCGSFDAVTRQIQNTGSLQATIGTSNGGGPSSAICPPGWGIQSIDFQNTYRIESARYEGCLICAPIPAAPKPQPQVLNGPNNATPQTLGRTGAMLPRFGGSPPPPPPPPPLASPPPPLPGGPVTSNYGKLPSDSDKVVRHSGFTGSWNMRTDKGWTYTITFEQNGRSVNGTFVAQNGDKGKINGTTKDGVLTFKWSQAGGFTGTGQIALASDGNSFSGDYRTDPNKKITDPSYLQGTWNATRQ